MGTNLIASEEVVCKFLLTKEGIRRIVNDDLQNGLSAIKETPVNLPAGEVAPSVSCNDSVTMCRDPSLLSEDNCPGLTVDHVEDETSNGMHACEENGEYPLTERDDFFNMDLQKIF